MIKIQIRSEREKNNSKADKNSVKEQLNSNAFYELDLARTLTIFANFAQN